jgi:hypothetical protein
MAQAGQEGLASLEVALAFPAAPDPVDAARRVFLADGMMEAGVSPRDIWLALELDPAPLDALEKYDPQELRNPKGDGRPSGEWTTGGGTAAAAAAAWAVRPSPWTVATTVDLADTAGRFAANLARWGRIVGAVAADVAPPAAFLGALLYSPDLGGPRIEGDVLGMADLAYARQSDEAALHVVNRSNGNTVMILYPTAQGTFIDRNTGVVAHIEDDKLVFDGPAVPGPQAQAQSKTQLDACPEPGVDKPGMIGARGARSKAYENVVKLSINPKDPTPQGYEYQLPNPMQDGKLVYYDDCQHEAGMLVEAKGPGYARLIKSGNPGILDRIARSWTRQATRQVDASEGRPIIWVFAEQGALDYACEVFSRPGNESLRGIGLVLLPWPEGENWPRARKSIFSWMLPALLQSCWTSLGSTDRSARLPV